MITSATDQPITRFERVFDLDIFSTIVTEDKIQFVFGKGENRSIVYIDAEFSNRIIRDDRGMETLHIRHTNNVGILIELAALLPFNIDQVFVMIGAGFGVFNFVRK